MGPAGQQRSGLCEGSGRALQAQPDPLSRPLSARAQACAAGRCMPDEQLWAVACQAAHGLAFLHSHGVLHLVRLRGCPPGGCLAAVFGGLAGAHEPESLPCGAPPAGHLGMASGNRPSPAIPPTTIQDMKPDNKGPASVAQCPASVAMTVHPLPCPLQLEPRQDIKPDNIYLSLGGPGAGAAPRWRIGDFGLAVARGQDGSMVRARLN